MLSKPDRFSENVRALYNIYRKVHLACQHLIAGLCAFLFSFWFSIDSAPRGREEYDSRDTHFRPRMVKFRNNVHCSTSSSLSSFFFLFPHSVIFFFFLSFFCPPPCSFINTSINFHFSFLLTIYTLL